MIVGLYNQMWRIEVCGRYGKKELKEIDVAGTERGRDTALQVINAGRVCSADGYAEAESR